MKLSHKNKLMHKKGIPQRAWTGRCNRRFLRHWKRANAVKRLTAESRNAGCYPDLTSRVFVRAIICQEKRTGRWRFNETAMFKRLRPLIERHTILPVLSDLQLNNGGLITPEMGMWVACDEPIRLREGSPLAAKLKPQGGSVNVAVVNHPNYGVPTRSVLAAIAGSAARVGSALKGLFSSKTKEKVVL